MDLIEATDKIFKQCHSLIKTKNHDYSAYDTTGFGNFRSLGDTNVEIGLVTRLGDKWARIRSFILSGKLNHEGIDDTLMDVINYCAILLAWRLANYSEMKTSNAARHGAARPGKARQC